MFYTGRHAGDPPGQMTLGEGSIINGTGSQTGSQRWGDYSAIDIDPVDDQTFWYINEYVPTTSAIGWRLRIGAFNLAGGGSPTPTATPTATATATATSTATATATPSTLVVQGFAINAKGSALGVPLAVTTAATVMDPANPRCDWCWNWTDTGDLRCFPIRVGETNSNLQPSATAGFLFSAAKAPWCDSAVGGDPSVGWKCASTSGTVNINTVEFAHCFWKSGNFP
jgi:hypothetical protein